ncbi:MAG: hypothetical protein ABL959_01485 [Pyrinomonadaceae bacterium]
MKKQLITNVILFLLLATGISAQSIDKTVESIKKRYAEISAKAKSCETDDDHGEYGELFMNTLTINSRNHQWRAVGIYGQTFKFFYKAVENDEKRLYPDQLVFVKVERAQSNRKYAEEYLYSDAGVLMFYSQKAENDGDVPSDRRVYFSGAKAIRIVEDSKSHDRRTAKDGATVNAINAGSTKISDMFLRSLKL